MTLWTQLRSAKLRVENERLTIDNRRLTEMWDTDREALTAEVERLREDLAQADKDTETAMRAMERQDAENKRLRKDLAESEAKNDQWQKKLAEAWAESDRLRVDLDAEATGRRILIRQMDVENERLRTTLGIYGDHLESCWLRQQPQVAAVGRSRCNCGYFDGLLKGSANTDDLATPRVASNEESSGS